MPSDRPHFQISREIVRSESIQVRGRGTRYHRSDYGGHGRMLLRRLAESRGELRITRDSTAMGTGVTDEHYLTQGY